ncbi:hypothetical protein A2U01_0063942 [Trifolium medium]|uniref:Uncharacterized protein n=1 Tax=Trifolium medium TaxID=97028 RepID=A0A392S470_9FABA|nr:hypothetical protein [Trifolium medium]
MDGTTFYGGGWLCMNRSDNTVVVFCSCGEDGERQSQWLWPQTALAT